VPEVISLRTYTAHHSSATLTNGASVTLAEGTLSWNGTSYTWNSPIAGQVQYLVVGGGGSGRRGYYGVYYGAGGGGGGVAAGIHFRIYRKYFYCSGRRWRRLLS
jgi:hypothetical protein